MADTVLGRYTDHAGVKRSIQGVSLVVEGLGGDGVAVAIPADETPLTNMAGGSYIFAVTATSWPASSSVALQWLGPDGTSWINAVAVNGDDASLTANGAIGVVVGNGASIRIKKTNAPVGVATSLS